MMVPLLSTLVLSSAIIAACSPAYQRGAEAAMRHERNTMDAERRDGPQPSAPTPRGATIERFGFATILKAPPRPYSDQPPPPVARGEGAVEELARHLGISSEEAMARMNPDEATRNAAVQLNQRLRAGARGNYVTVAIERDPLPYYVFYFKRDAAATLARFTNDPRFRARQQGVPREELQPLFDEWWKRMEPDRLVGGGSVDAREGLVRFDMNVDEADFREIAARKGWQVPARLALNFSSPRNPRSVDPALASFVRVFAREDRRPAIVLQAALHGRVILRDGCFRLADSGGTGEPLVVFGRDSELALDDRGYMIVRQPGSERPSPRIGEMMVWAGPRDAAEEDAGVRKLRARCGSGPVIAVGEPESVHAFRVRPYAVDNYASAKRISRQAAWNRIKACFAEEDARVARGGPDATRPMRECDSAYPDGPPPPPPSPPLPPPRPGS
jgi:hypothetical protein